MRPPPTFVRSRLAVPPRHRPPRRPLPPKLPNPWGEHHRCGQRGHEQCSGQGETRAFRHGSLYNAGRKGRASFWRGIDRMTLARVLEPEVMASEEEAHDYDAMDHGNVNARFCDDLLALRRAPRRVLDVGTGTAQIPVALLTRSPETRCYAMDLSGADAGAGPPERAEAAASPGRSPSSSRTRRASPGKTTPSRSS